MTSNVVNQRKLLRLLQLNSPSLPIGTYAYSQGLESAISQGVVSDIKTAGEWLKTVLKYSLMPNDMAMIVRAYQAWQAEDIEQIDRLISQSRALRETEELLQEDTHLSQALMRLAETLEVAFPEHFPRKSSLPVVYARFAQTWQISIEETLTAFAWSWMENQIAALLKLCSVGQTQAQKLMLEMDDAVLQAVDHALSLEDSQVGMSLPVFAILSSQHEQQYSRLFRS